MIIECRACRARFRLDESKIKGKGARIRCRKCGESIIVMKSDIPPSPQSPPAAKELFDLRAVLKEPETRPPLPAREEVGAAFESMKNRERETGQAPPPAPEEPSQPSFPRDEGDDAFGSMKNRERETGQAPHLVVDEPAPPGEEAQEAFAQGPAGPSLTRDETTAFESPLFLEEEEQPPAAAEPPPHPAEEEWEADVREPMGDPPPHGGDITSGIDTLLGGKRERGTFGQEPAEPSFTRDEVDDAFESILGKERETGQETPPPAGEWTLPREDRDIFFPLEAATEDDIASLRESGETPAQGQDRHTTEFLSPDTALPAFLRRGDAAKGQGKQFDISEQLGEVPIGVPGEDVAPASPAPESPAPGMDPAAMRAETIRDEMSDMAESISVEESVDPDSSPPEIPSPQPVDVERTPAIRPRSSAPSGKPSVAVLALLFVVLAGGGAYLAFTKSGQETLHALIPGMESLWLGGKESVKPYSIGNLIGYYETGDSSGRMFVIKGLATNQGRNKISGIRIRAELLDGDHQTIAEKTAYAGNIIAGLRSAEQEKIETAMSNRFGDKLSNVDVAPGKSVPFMLVFFNPPEGIEEYRLEVLDGD